MTILLIVIGTFINFLKLLGKFYAVVFCISASKLEQISMQTTTSIHCEYYVLLLLFIDNKCFIAYYDI